MPVCFFNGQENKYRCEYKIDNDCIEVIVDYDITEEIEEINGVRYFGINTRFNDRDILIINHEKYSILVKNAYYNGHHNVMGTLDSGAKSYFKSNLYFIHNEFTRLSNLPPTPKVKSIRIYSETLAQLIGHPCLTEIIKKDKHEIYLSKLDNSTEIEINGKNIKSIRVSDTWDAVKKLNNISIDLKGYIEINLKRRVNYDLIYQYINEILIFMQLYIPNSFSVDAIKVSIDEIYYTFFCPTLNIEQKNKSINKSVDVTLLDFIEKCYCDIPYRNSKSEIRNIPYIINKATHVEDNFLMFYRFIECYYKKRNLPNIKKTFISYSINKHYCKFKELTNEEVDNYTHEIIALRNHYIHAGYYIKNSSLKIRFEKIDNHKNPKDYTANNVDVYWILERTEILYKIAVDIIFTEMLKYDEYRYKN